ncbi:MAG: RluA family pseudouridine synthase [Clostridia bacterium]|nr:RluA family pseudouridine synthase [Clostridia bacterium]
MNFVCDETSAGIRLDVFLSEQADLTRSAAQKLIENGDVTVSGEQVNKNYKLRLRDEIAVALPEAKELTAQPENIPVEIVYEDDSLLVVNKEQGMVVHPAAGHDSGTLVNALLYHAKGRLSAINGVIRPGIVHRIDKDTSGILVVAKTNQAHLSLAEQIKEHSVSREYFCIAHGTFKEDSFTVDKPIGRHPKDRKKMAVVASSGRNAVTHVTVVRQFSRCALLRCRLETGRTHQIRVHLSSIGHPVAGDPVYGVKNDPLTKKYALTGQLLHAALLGFLHPETNEYVEFSAPLPKHFQQVVDDLERKG